MYNQRCNVLFALGLQLENLFAAIPGRAGSGQCYSTRLLHWRAESDTIMSAQRVSLQFASVAFWSKYRWR